MNQPVPNHVIIAEADYFRNGEFVDRYYTVHIPIVDEELAGDIGDEVFKKFASAVDFEFSDDDGGHLCVYYDIDFDKYKSAGISIARTVKNIRDKKTQNGHIYSSKMTEPQDYVKDKTEERETEDDSNDEDLRYIH